MALTILRQAYATRRRARLRQVNYFRNRSMIRRSARRSGVIRSGLKTIIRRPIQYQPSKQNILGRITNRPQLRQHQTQQTQQARSWQTGGMGFIGNRKMVMYKGGRGYQQSQKRL